MLRMKKQGFTLIELMVVIVIIGVLASLAIPRFTDASNKAKVAEAPRVIASFESAYLAGVAEGNVSTDNLVFKTDGLDSKWFTYDFVGLASTQPTTGDGIQAQLKGTLVKISGGTQVMTATYDPNTEYFSHSVHTDMSRFVPNFIKTPAPAAATPGS